jgi:hypothetical protein
MNWFNFGAEAEEKRQEQLRKAKWEAEARKKTEEAKVEAQRLGLNKDCYYYREKFNRDTFFVPDIDICKHEEHPDRKTDPIYGPAICKCLEGCPGIDKTFQGKKKEIEHKLRLELQELEKEALRQKRIAFIKKMQTENPV